MYKEALLFVILASAQAQLVSNGVCNFSNLIYQRDSNSIALNNLFEIIRITNSWNTGQCASWHFTRRNNFIFVTSREVVSRSLIERNTYTNENINGIFSLTFPDFSSNFTILGNSRNYAVLYACTNQGPIKLEYAWILGRKRTISSSERNRALNVLRNNNLNKAMVEISQTTASCRTGGANNLKLSPIIVLIVGFMVSKGL